MRIRRYIGLLLPSRAILRVTAYAAFVFFVMACLAARVLMADINEAALAAGHELSQLADLLGGTEHIQLNGERMHHASTYTDQDVSQVLDRFESYCASSPSVLGRAMSDFPKELAAKVEKKIPDRPMRLGFVRDEANGRGMIACFVSDQPSGFAGITERIKRFLATWNLGEFGKFRYAFAEKTKGGDTHVVTVWADTGLDIRTMFPTEGDAAGTDSLLLPRPPDARRTMSAFAEGMTYGLRIYTSTQRADALKNYYETWMGNNRFQRIDDGEHDGTLAYLRDDGTQVFVTIGDEGEHTSVTLVEAARAGVPSTATVHVTED